MLVGRVGFLSWKTLLQFGNWHRPTFSWVDWKNNCIQLWVYVASSV